MAAAAGATSGASAAALGAGSSVVGGMAGFDFGLLDVLDQAQFIVMCGQLDVTQPPVLKAMTAAFVPFTGAIPMPGVLDAVDDARAPPGLADYEPEEHNRTPYGSGFGSRLDEGDSGSGDGGNATVGDRGEGAGGSGSQGGDGAGQNNGTSDSPGDGGSGAGNSTGDGAVDDFGSGPSGGPDALDYVWIDPESGFPFEPIEGCDNQNVPAAISTLAYPLGIHPRSLFMYAVVALVIVLLLVAVVGVISCGVLEWYIQGKLRKNIAAGSGQDRQRALERAKPGSAGASSLNLRQAGAGADSEEKGAAGNDGDEEEAKAREQSDLNSDDEGEGKQDGGAAASPRSKYSKYTDEWASNKRGKLFWRFVGFGVKTCMAFYLLLSVLVVYELSESCSSEGMDVFGWFWMIFYLVGAVIIAAYWIQSKSLEDLKMSPTMRLALGPLYKRYHGKDRLFFVVILADRFLSALILVLLSGWPVLQTLVLLLKQVVYVAVIIATAPIQHYFIFRVTVLTGLARAVILFCMMLLAPGVLGVGTRDEVLEAIGWTIAVLHLLVLLAILILLLIKIKRLGAWLAKQCGCCGMGKKKGDKKDRIDAAKKPIEGAMPALEDGGSTTAAGARSLKRPKSHVELLAGATMRAKSNPMFAALVDPADPEVEKMGGLVAVNPLAAKGGLGGAGHGGSSLKARREQRLARQKEEERRGAAHARGLAGDSGKSSKAKTRRAFDSMMASRAGEPTQGGSKGKGATASASNPLLRGQGAAGSMGGEEKEVKGVASPLRGFGPVESQGSQRTLSRTGPNSESLKDIRKKLVGQRGLGAYRSKVEGGAAKLGGRRSSGGRV